MRVLIFALNALKMSPYMRFSRLMVESLVSPSNSARFRIGEVVGGPALGRISSSYHAKGATTTFIKPISVTSGYHSSHDFRLDDVLPRLRQTSGAKFEFGLQNVNAVCDYLTITLGASADAVVEMFVRRPALGDDEVPLRRWTEAIDVLLSSGGLPVDSVVAMIADCPQIVARATPQQLEASLDALRREHLTGELLTVLLLRAPVLLVTSPSFLRQRLERLKGLVTHGDFFQLLPACPNVMLDDWEDLEAVVQYVAFRIGLDQTQMVNSKVLSHPLSHVRIRHQLMTRTGKFQKPRPKKPIDSNPHLTKMVDTSDEQFVRFVGISIEEYEVFERVLQKELDKEFKESRRKLKSKAEDVDDLDSESEDD